MMKKGCVCSQSELLYTLSGQSILKQILKKKKKENKKDHKYRQCNAKTILQYKIWYFSFFWKLTWPGPSLRTSAAGWDVGDLLASPLLNHACSESIRSYRLTAQNKVKKKKYCAVLRLGNLFYQSGLVAHTWDYFHSQVGVAQEVVQGVFLMVILSLQLRLHTDTGSINRTLGTHSGSWMPGVWCQELLHWKTTKTLDFKESQSVYLQHQSLKVCGCTSSDSGLTTVGPLLSTSWLESSAMGIIGVILAEASSSMVLVTAYTLELLIGRQQ